MRRPLATAAILTALGACATTVQPGDTDGPGLTISDPPGDELRLYQIAEGPGPAGGRTCDGYSEALEELYTEAQGFTRGSDQRRIDRVVTPRRGVSDLLFLVGDESGIRSVRIEFYEDVEVIEPADLEEVTVRRGRRSSATYQEYAFRESGGLRSPHAATFKARISRGTGSGSGRGDEIIVRAVDGAGNRATYTLLVAEDGTCRSS